jgi:hypothetical protein
MLERSKSLVLLQVGGYTCRWQRHSVKPSCWECSTTVEQAETQLRVVVPTEEEEDSELVRSILCWVSSFLIYTYQVWKFHTSNITICVKQMTREARPTSRHDEITKFREFSALKVDTREGFSRTFWFAFRVNWLWCRLWSRQPALYEQESRAEITQDQWHVIKRSWSVNKGTDWTSSSYKHQLAIVIAPPFRALNVGDSPYECAIRIC